jgi:predicted phosphodiesterase
MRIAVLADIHGNLQALDAVLVAIGRERVDLVLCLGDLVGYNANPSECIQRVRESADVVIAGNHDWDTVRDVPTRGTSPEARLAQEWTRARLSREEQEYLSALPNHVVQPGTFVAAHGCYLNDTFVSGYVTSTMLPRNLEVLAANPAWPVLAFCGHTHAPLCGWLERAHLGESRLSEPVRWPASAQAVLVNPGSVGQPRDGDPRAAFAIVDSERRQAEARRVAYDVGDAARAVVDAGLPSGFAQRLHEGR